MWLPVIVETIPVNQEVPCKFMFVAFFFFLPHLRCICKVLFSVFTPLSHNILWFCSFLFCRSCYLLNLIAVAVT